MEEIIEEDDVKSKDSIKTVPSVNSVIEMSSKSRTLFSLSLFVINIISFITGLYILYHNDYYLNPEYKFVNHISLYIFIIIYILGMISALIFSFLFALIMKIIYYYKNNIKKSLNISNNNNSNLELIPNEEGHSPITSFIMKNKQNKIALIPFTLSYFIAFSIGIYLTAFPYAFLLIYNLLQNDVLCTIFSFKLLYLFMVINLCAGLINFFVLIYLVFVKTRGNIRKMDYNIDNNNIENIRNEIRNAMK
jgi:H+/Cl- antiporter ClcA